MPKWLSELHFVLSLWFLTVMCQTFWSFVKGENDVKTSAKITGPGPCQPWIVGSSGSHLGLALPHRDTWWCLGAFSDTQPAVIWLLPKAWAEGWEWPWPCHPPQWLPHGQEGFLGGSAADRMDVVLSRAAPRGHPPLAWLPSTSGLHAAGVSGYLGHLPLRSGLRCLQA